MTTVAHARRSHSGKAQTSPIGTGQLHQALEDSRDLARLHDFCSAHVCTVDQVSDDSVRLAPLKVFDLMRQHGYQVSEPRRPKQQLRKGFTAWLIDVTLPGGSSCSLAFHTPDTS